MERSSYPNLCLSAGVALRSSIAWGLLGAFLPFLAIAIIQAHERWQDLTMLGEYRGWFLSTVHKSLWPIIGCSAVLTCSAWVANVTQPARSIAVCLMKVAGASIPLWYLLAALQITPRRLKGMVRPEIYFSEFLLLVVPPMAVACLLTWTSIRREHKRCSSPDGQPLSLKGKDS